MDKYIINLYPCGAVKEYICANMQVMSVFIGQVFYTSSQKIARLSKLPPYIHFDILTSVNNLCKQRVIWGYCETLLYISTHRRHAELFYLMKFLWFTFQGGHCVLDLLCMRYDSPVDMVCIFDAAKKLDKTQNWFVDCRVFVKLH